MWVKIFYHIKSLIHRISSEWSNAGRIITTDPTQNRVKIYFDLLYSFYFQGFDFTNYCSFKLWLKNKEERGRYISYRKSAKLAQCLATSEVYDIFLNKSEFNNIFYKFCYRPWMNAEGKSHQSILDFISKNGVVIAKPLRSYGGGGVMRIKDTDSHIPVDYMILHKYILEGCIENVESIKRLAPGSLNTLRIVSMIDKYGKLNIIAAVLRMGNGISHTDNFLDGGIACPIDISSGSLRSVGYDKNMNEYYEHPYSKIKFDKYPVEKFSECVKLLGEIVNVVPTARYVGWDFAITPNGIEILEGNIPPGENITQLAAGRGLWFELQQMI